MPPRISSSVVARPAKAAVATIPKILLCPHGATQLQQTASFSSTASQDAGFSKARREFRKWIKEEAHLYKNPGTPLYITDRRSVRLGLYNKTLPFRENPAFQAQPVLSEGAREKLWQKIMVDGETIKAVAAEYSIDMRRLAAVIRLKEVEKAWKKKGQKLATPYARAILSILKTHNIFPNAQNKNFESINEVHVHPHTTRQIFWPTAESTHFTRKDAAKVFNPAMLPLEERVQIPELVQLEKNIKNGTSPFEAAQRFKTSVRESELKAAERARKRAATAEQAVQHVKTDRFDLRFTNYNSENVGQNGRRRAAPGARYGVPHTDRVKGQIKIPTSVP